MNSNNNIFAEQEIERLTKEQDELTHKLEIVASNIALLRKVCDSSADHAAPTEKPGL